MSLELLSLKKYEKQMIGTLLLVVSWVLFIIHQPWLCLGLLVIVGIYDWRLSFKKEKTISNWVHKLFGKTLDFIIMTSLLGVSVWAILQWKSFGPVEVIDALILGKISGHLFWNED